MSDDIITTEKKPITYSIYKINLNNKVYIGYTKREPLHRIKQHIYVANCVGKSHEIENLTRLKHAIRKYGAENLTYEVLAITTDHNEALEIEEKYIALYDSTNCEKGYNMLKNGAVYDPFARNRDFYKDEKYRKIRSEVVRGEKNGRYTGITDDMIIDKAIEYFLSNKKIYITPWLLFCKTIKYPQQYCPFRFDGEGIYGFYKFFLSSCKRRSIVVNFEDIVCIVLKGDSFVKMVEVYKQYNESFRDEHIPFKYSTNWEKRNAIERQRIRNENRSKMAANSITKENNMVDEAFKYLKTNKQLHFKKWQNYRKIIGLPQTYAKNSFNGRGHAGLCEKVLKKCLTENIKVELSQLTCIDPNKVLNIDLLNVYDNYKKAFEEKTCL